MEGGNKMTREEQIRQAGIEYTLSTRPMCIGGDAFSELIDEINRCPSFEEGAKWADRTLIEKACEWLKLNTNWDDEWDEMGRNMNYGKIEEFRKVMEE